MHYPVAFYKEWFRPNNLHPNSKSTELQIRTQLLFI